VPSDRQAIWALTPEAAIAVTESDADSGLGDAEASQRLKDVGPNSLPQTQRQSGWHRFLRQFQNLLIYLLLLAAAVTLSLGHWLDSAVILSVVLINAVIGVIQEGRAEAALDEIRAILSPTVTVVREGRRQTLSVTDLVPGDLILLSAGDRVPADLRLIEANRLLVDESVLTGESLPVEKHHRAAAESAALVDRHSMVWAGTLVTAGQARAIVTATGLQTELGRISGLLRDVAQLQTPLTVRMTRFGQTLSVVIIVVSILLFALGVFWREIAPAEMFMSAVSLAVAAIPEGLPAIVTITLAIGVRRMANRRAIIRRLPAVEAIGAVSVICTDKTGTLTLNQMTVQQTVGHAEARMGRVAALCNDSALLATSDGQDAIGDPTELALLRFAQGIGADAQDLHLRFRTTSVIPFDPDLRWMATQHADPASGNAIVLMKGAPERVLAYCDREAIGDQDQPIDGAQWQAQIDALAAQGMRVLALAERIDAADPSTRQLSLSTIQEGGFVLLGLVGLADPPRPEAAAAIARCKAAGIAVKMITGDHPQTARAIGRAVGLSASADRLHVLTGAQIDLMSDDQLARAVRVTDIFARTLPEHKLRLVKAFQALDEVVVMTGDGVNDAPALKRADVGVAMGQKGSEAAKEAAQMVLADDNFASITAAVEEGRTVFHNIRKSIVFTLPTNGGEAGMLIIAILMGITMPITAVQILWINMVTEITLGLAIAFEKADTGVMSRPPRPARQSLIDRHLVWRILFVSGLLVAGCLGIFLWELERGSAVEVARTSAVNALVMGQVAYLFNVRRLSASSFTLKALQGNIWLLWAILALIAVQLSLTYASPLNLWFGTAPIDQQAWQVIGGFSLVLFVLVELEKALIPLLFKGRGAYAG
jgi:calcium-translocating P-type ATPase